MEATEGGTNTNLHGGEKAAGPVFGIGKVTDHAPVETIEVVRTELTKVGDGTEGNPFRKLTEYWTLDGELLATVDPADDVEIALAETEGHGLTHVPVSDEFRAILEQDWSEPVQLRIEDGQLVLRSVGHSQWAAYVAGGMGSRFDLAPEASQ